MTNKNRSKSYSKKKFGRYQLTRRDILVIEKILRIYADAYEKKHLLLAGENPFPADGRRNMPRKYADMHVTIGEMDADSIKFIPKSIKFTRYLKVQCSQGIIVSFTPLATEIAAQTNYATGNELKIMKEVVSKIGNYLLGSKKSFFNIVRLDL